MRLHLSAFLRLLDEQPDLLRGVDGFFRAGGLLSEQAQDELRRPVQEIGERSRYPREEEQRRGQPFRYRLGMVERGGLRRQLSEHDVQIRDDHECDGCAEGQAQRHLDREGKVTEEVDEDFSDGFLGDPAESEARQRHSKLAGGEYAGDI